MIHCPGCGQGLRFDIKTQMMLCDFCGSSFDPAESAKNSRDAEEHEEQGEGLDAYVFTCPSCGGELMATDKTDAIGFCPFCGGASMIYSRLYENWKPAYVIPFKITKDQCRELYLKKVKQSLFTSKKYRDPGLIEGFRGIYMPYWNYHARHEGRFSVNAKRKTATAVQQYRISGNLSADLEGYGHDASTAFDDRISENLAPYDLDEKKPFAPGYLSGFYADIGDVDPNYYCKDIADEITSDTIKALNEKMSKRHFKVSEQDAVIPVELTDAERTLYPVWFMSYRDNDKITYATVNGQTGKVSADLPVSPWKILLTVLIVGAVIAGAMFFLPSVKANGTLAFTALLLAVGYVVLRLNFNNTVNEKTGLIKTEEAKRFKKHEAWRMFFVIISVVGGFALSIADLAYNWISYLGCLVLAAVLFWVMLSHIRFQAEIARRKPPQFNKKGAAYDES